MKAPSLRLALWSKGEKRDGQVGHRQDTALFYDRRFKTFP